MERIRSNLFYLFVGGIHEEVMQRSENGDIAVALEGLRDNAAQDLLLEVYLAFGDNNADENTLAHDVLLYER